MHICLASQWYPKGGVGVYTYYMALGLARLGHRMSVISTRLGDSEEIEQAARHDLQIHEISLNNYPSLAGRALGLKSTIPGIRDAIYALKVRKAINEIHNREPLDIVEYADIRAEGLWHRSDQIPSIIKLHTPQFVLDSLYSEKSIPVNTRLNRYIEKRAILRATTLTAPSDAIAERVSTEYQIPKNQIAIIRNPIDVDRFTAVDKRGLGKPMVLFVGRLEAMKGTLLFAEAIPLIAAAIPQARFFFAGKDRMTAEYESGRRMIERIVARAGVGGRVHFQDDAPSEVFRVLYQRASVCVVPSLFENHPYVLLEAMASGVPVVASAAGGIPEILIHERTGLLCSTGQAKSLAEQVIRLLEKPKWAIQLGQAGRDFVIRECSLETVAVQTSDAYRCTIEKHVAQKGRPI
jgi:glycogen(starch) synthase